MTPEQIGKQAYNQARLTVLHAATDVAHDAFIAAKMDFLRAKERLHQARERLAAANSPEVKEAADAAGRDAAALAYKAASEQEVTA